MVTDRRWRPSITPWPMRPVMTGASSISAIRATCSPAPCAPPPTTISGRCALPSSLAARSTASSSTGQGSALAGVAISSTGALRRPGVHRAFERHRTAPARQQAAEGFVDQAGRLGRRVDAVGPLGEAAHDRELVGQLVQQPDIAADHRLLDLAGQRQHRRVHRIGGRQRRRGVEEARARHHDVGRRLAARHGIAQRHVGAGLLVAGMDRPDGVGAVVQRVEERIVLHAGQAEDRVDAVHFQHRHDGLGGGQGGHGTLSALLIPPPPSYGGGREGESLTGYALRYEDS